MGLFDPANRNRTLFYVLINQCATPGLGSLLAGRWIAGAGQLALAVTGFGLLMTWMSKVFFRMLLEQLEKPAPTDSLTNIAHWGFVCFGTAWLWSLWTSIFLLRKDRPPPIPQDVTK